MRGKQARSLCRDLIAEMNLDRSATTLTVCRRLCEVTSTRLRHTVLLCFDDLGQGLTGLTARKDDGSYIIVVTTARSWLHRLHILAHETFHLFCGHKTATLSDEEGRRLLFPDLSSDMVSLIARRTTPSRGAEREAERLAGTLMHELLVWADEQRVDLYRPEGDTLETRVWYALGYDPKRDHRGR